MTRTLQRPAPAARQRARSPRRVSTRLEIRLGTLTRTLVEVVVVAEPLGVGRAAARPTTGRAARAEAGNRSARVDEAGAEFEVGSGEPGSRAVARMRCTAAWPRMPLATRSAATPETNGVACDVPASSS